MDFRNTPLGLQSVNMVFRTHFNKKNNTPLDLFLVKDQEKVLLYDQLSVPAFSRHDFIFCTYDFDVTHTTQKYSYRDFKNVNLQELLNKTIQINWEIIIYILCLQ